VKYNAYIGRSITNKNELKPETEKIIKNANMTYHALLAVLYSTVNQYSEQKT
jgi:hypothetical protein